MGGEVVNNLVWKAEMMKCARKMHADGGKSRFDQGNQRLILNVDFSSRVNQRLISNVDFSSRGIPFAVPQRVSSSRVDQRLILNVDSSSRVDQRLILNVGSSSRVDQRLILNVDSSSRLNRRLISNVDSSISTAQLSFRSSFFFLFSSTFPLQEKTLEVSKCRSVVE